ncbi:hypothetical protein EVAR_61201_1 [Eumeta japonica]|uniref:Uncharacterized protein n=1 Tax=Eumeta variegata TaxID=151549 RepID=A0A4C1YYK0_EUMVA|nr:hypothetical protein EVAR_61201_1 [Eumeta japonica]
MKCFKSILYLGSGKRCVYPAQIPLSYGWLIIPRQRFLPGGSPTRPDLQLVPSRFEVGHPPGFSRFNDPVDAVLQDLSILFRIKPLPTCALHLCRCPFVNLISLDALPGDMLPSARSHVSDAPLFESFICSGGTPRFGLSGLPIDVRKQKRTRRKRRNLYRKLIRGRPPAGAEINPTDNTDQYDWPLTCGSGPGLRGVGAAGCDPSKPARPPPGRVPRHRRVLWTTPRLNLINYRPLISPIAEPFR